MQKISAKPKILHIAPFNVAGVPMTFVKAERELGYHSRLITLGKHHHNYEEDICLNLPFIDLSNSLFIKKLFSNKTKMEVFQEIFREMQNELYL